MVTVASFSISHTGFIDPQGEATGPLPPFAADSEALADMYRAMVLTRLFDKKAVALQRTGQLGTFPSAIGAEAIGVALASAMRAEDVLLPSYRRRRRLCLQAAARAAGGGVHGRRRRDIEGRFL
jgi:2-oxoisovalerate dehydrogenase E1 component alpha subunit